MQQVIVAHAERLLKDKRAMLIAATNYDACQIGGAWRTVGTPAHGTEVEAVRHFHRHETRAGDRLRVENDDGRGVAVIRIDRIRYVRTGDLTAEQIGALGYADRAAFEDDEPGYAIDRAAWLIDVTPIRRIWLGVL